MRSKIKPQGTQIQSLSRGGSRVIKQEKYPGEELSWRLRKMSFKKEMVIDCWKLWKLRKTK